MVSNSPTGLVDFGGGSTYQQRLNGTLKDKVYKGILHDSYEDPLEANIRHM